MANTSWSGQRRSFPPATRRLILNRQPQCATGCGRPSEIVDHIVNYPNAMRAGWTLDEYHSPDNGQGMAAVCHDEKTRAEQAQGRARRPSRYRKPQPHPGELRGGGRGPEK